ncbi:MAG TPA: hypothetical protein VFU62_05900, partial [Hanamia sp.]|nr:hypothetical protein [Hanamia sp.]
MIQVSKKEPHLKRGILPAFLLLSFTFFMFSCKTNPGNNADESKIDTVLTGTVTAELTTAPNVPKPLTYT